MLTRGILQAYMIIHTILALTNLFMLLYIGYRGYTIMASLFTIHGKGKLVLSTVASFLVGASILMCLGVNTIPGVSLSVLGAALTAILVLMPTVPLRELSRLAHIKLRMFIL